MDREDLKTNKRFNIVKIILLRKIMKERQKNIKYSFQRIGLGNIKYEICPNFAYDQIKAYRTFFYSSCFLYEYNIKKQKVEKTEKQIDPLSSNFSRVVQINENDLIISGGSLSRRLTFYNSQKSEESKMKDERGIHGVAFDQEKIFILSG